MLQTKTLFLACDECDENEKSVARCKDCFKFLGENCLKAHKSMKTFAKHRVFTLRDVTFDVNSISDFRSAGICSNHDQVLKLYCAGKECQAPVCHSCCLTSHMDDQNHVRRNIDEVYSEKKDNLLEKEIKLADMAIELDQLSSKVVQTVDYLDENSKEVENEITAIFHIAMEMLQRRRNYLLEEVKGIKRIKKLCFKKQEEDICFLRQSITDACEFLNQSLASKNQAAFLILSKTIAERFDYLLKTDFNKVPHDDNLINFRKSGGTKSISRICIKVNGKDFHCIKLDTTVKDGEEVCTNGTKTKVAEPFMETELSDQRKEYAVTEEQNENTYPKYERKDKFTEHAQIHRASKNEKEDILTGNVKGDTDSEGGKTDTLSDEQSTLDSKNEDGSGEEKREYANKQRRAKYVL
ncbi:unnamed protein product [Mytilus edulis]|uniref:B box-type domain-containing protein n=1 Tax=Mytilus edulis TaxID=6550 RepID=A0A8S3Q644_MYTED|nr:unnamed protein product [Mytilus edulis]